MCVCVVDEEIIVGGWWLFAEEKIAKWEFWYRKIQVLNDCFFVRHECDDFVN